jgi:tetratricopeptide (TPR) repeat protein
MYYLATGVLVFLVTLSSPLSPTAFTLIKSRLKSSNLKYYLFQEKSRAIWSYHERSCITMLASGSESSDSNIDRLGPAGQTFRDAEEQGLRLMQQGRHLEALECFQQGLRLPGSRIDIVRSQTQAGPSPVGGSSGGKTSQVLQTLDEFEYQAAYYNIGCAYACLGRIDDAIANLRKSFEYGFDNFEACSLDPDLRGIQGTAEFNELLDSFDRKKKGGIFNPFKFFDRM